MNIEIKRDGLTLRGELLRPNNEKSPLAVIFHGLMSSIGYDDEHLFKKLANRLLEYGIASVRFDFNGHGKSDGLFSDMTVYGELLDASKIMDYVRGLDFVTDIYIAGHSQGGLVGGMTAGYYRDIIKKLVLLAPASTIKSDALKGDCFGQTYDTVNVPERIVLYDLEHKAYDVGSFYLRTAKTLPIYETTAMFEGPTLIIHGTLDPAVSYHASEEYHKVLKNSELVLLEGENHGLDEFSLYETIERVCRFLK